MGRGYKLTDVDRRVLDAMSAGADAMSTQDIERATGLEGCDDVRRSILHLKKLGFIERKTRGMDGRIRWVMK